MELLRPNVHKDTRYTWCNLLNIVKECWILIASHALVTLFTSALGEYYELSTEDLIVMDIGIKIYLIKYLKKY